MLAVVPGSSQQVRQLRQVSVVQPQHRPALLPCCLVFLPIYAAPLCLSGVLAWPVKMLAAICLQYCPMPLCWCAGSPWPEVPYEVAGAVGAAQQLALCGPQRTAGCPF